MIPCTTRPIINRTHVPHCTAQSGQPDPRAALQAKQGIGLVYGGGGIGLMGAIARTVHESGGHVLGIIPEALHEISGDMFGDTRVVPDMHTRKAAMAEAADAFIALPGGFGTLEELLEMVTWQQLGYTKKSVGVLNINGYYDKLLAFIDHSVEEGFISPHSRGIVLSASEPAELIKLLKAHVPPDDIVSVAKASGKYNNVDIGEVMQGASEYGTTP